MRPVTTDHLRVLLAEQEAPCISLYQPTHRCHPDNQQDPIRYRNLLKQMESSLLQKYPARDIQKLVATLQGLARDDSFWQHRTDGLAILVSAGTFQVFDLQRTVSELVVVADGFHTKPLLRILQSTDRYQILALSRHEAKLYEGNPYVIDPVEMPNVASTLTDALGKELTEQHLTVASYGAGAARAAGGGAPPSVHAHGDKKDEVDIDRDRFFRSIDQGVLEHHSRPSGLPLILAALTEHHAPFHEISKNPFLIANGIMKNPDALSLDQLRAEAWRIVEPAYVRDLAKMVDDYRVAKSRKLGSDDLAEIAHAATAGRVGTLLIENDRQIPGKIDSAGKVQPGNLSDPEVDDVLDDLAALVMRMNGAVVVVPSKQMPSTTGAAAIFRF